MNDSNTPLRPQTESDGDADPGNRSRWLFPLLVTMSIGLILMLGAFVTTHFLNQERTAQAFAQEYFDALAAGDASKANALTSSNSDTSGDPTFLTDEVLAAASERISEVEVVAADDPLDVFDQKVVVSYSLAGQAYSHEVTLRQGDPEWGVLRTWQMPRHFTTDVVFSVYGPGTLTIAGLPINPDSSAGQAELFPAIYPLEVLESQWVGLQDDEIVVDKEASFVSLTLIPTDSLTAEVQLQLDEFLDECVAELVFSSSNKGTDCALTANRSEAGNPTGSWEIIDYPVATPELGGAVYAYEGGDARFTPNDGGESATTLRGFDIARYVDVTEEAVTLTTEYPST